MIPELPGWGWRDMLFLLQLVVCESGVCLQNMRLLDLQSLHLAKPLRCRLRTLLPGISSQMWPNWILGDRTLPHEGLGVTRPWLPLAALASLNPGAAEFCLCVPMPPGPSPEIFFPWVSYMGLCSPFLPVG